MIYCCNHTGIREGANACLLFGTCQVLGLFIKVVLTRHPFGCAILWRQLLIPGLPAMNITFDSISMILSCSNESILFKAEALNLLLSIFKITSVSLLLTSRLVN